MLIMYSGYYLCSMNIELSRFIVIMMSSIVCIGFVLRLNFVMSLLLIRKFVEVKVRVNFYICVLKSVRLYGFMSVM